MNYKNANEAYEKTLEKIKTEGIIFQNTKALINHGFTIDNPFDNLITNVERKWSHKYAKKEFAWYLSANPSANEIAKQAKIWYNHMDSNGNVNSNYGAQLSRNEQLIVIINKLVKDKTTRQAWLTIYDAKDTELSPFTNNGFKNDTPCTLSIGFQYYNDKLHMSVLMRSNDIHYGFCNDQYCFTELFKIVCKETNLDAGTYYHWAANIHLYL